MLMVYATPRAITPRRQSRHATTLPLTYYAAIADLRRFSSSFLAAVTVASPMPLPAMLTLRH